MNVADKRVTAVSNLRAQIMSMARRLRREANSDEGAWSRLLLLGAIDRQGGNVTPSQLAASEGMRSSNLAAALRDLERLRLLRRTPDQHDGRVVRLSLTASGKTSLNAVRLSRDRWLAKAIDLCLTPKELTVLLQAGDLIERLAKHQAGEGSADPGGPVDSRVQMDLGTEVERKSGVRSKSASLKRT
jgi:DNA-binding MarR family transcriptional regulator